MEYSDTVKYHGVPQDAIKCMLFTFSLRDDARAWYRSLPSRSFGWNEISRAFLDKYFPLHKQSAIRDEIFNFVQREAGGAITNKTLDEAFLLIESIAFHQLQWYNKKPTSDSLVCLQQITTPQPPILTQKPEPLSQCDKIELAWIIFDDDDTILVDTHATDHMDTSVGDSVLHCDDSSMDEPELQLVVFDIEESPLVDIDHVLLEPDMEKFTFDDVSRIASSTLEPEMESFMVEYGEVDSDVKEPSSTISLVDTSPVEISTTTPHLVSSIEVVLKLLPNYLRYDLSFLDKTCHIADIAYAPCDLLLIHVPDLINRYTYMIGYSIDDLEGILSVTVLAWLLSVLSG
uniref:Retrotransposon gag domain-containing protein n=1 Tax=Triticum aestivum TaxID=4565 RepID=A0A3B6JHQ4_WHEAT